MSSDLDEAIGKIGHAAGQRVVVLASGDPLFYGVARYLCDKLGKDRFDVVPHVSSMQLAFARVKESWEEAYLTNLANHRLDEVIEKIRMATKVGLVHHRRRQPTKAVAKALLDRRIDYFSAYVCENLGSPDERVTQGELAEIAGQDFSPLNVMILVRRPDVPDRPRESIGHRLFGNPDEAFLQSKPKQGLLTPAEVRAIALAEMDLGPTSIVWDIGAGSGSVAIEAAQIAGRRHRLCHRNGCGRPRTDSRQRRALRRGEPGGRAGPRSRRLGGAARSGQHFCRRQRPGDQPRSWSWPTSGCGPAGGWWPTWAASKVCRACTRRLARLDKDVKVLMINIARGTYQLERVRFEAHEPHVFVERGEAGRQRREQACWEGSPSEHQRLSAT